MMDPEHDGEHRERRDGRFTAQRLRPLRLRSGVPRPSGWRNVLLPNDAPVRGIVARFVLALALSTALWVRVSAMQDPVREVHYRSIPIEILRPSNYYPARSPGFAAVTVQGLQSDLKDAGQPTAYVDLRNASGNYPQSVSAPVRVGNLPNGVKVTHIDPKSVGVQLQKAETRTVRVVVQSVSPPHPGYTVSQLSVTPSSVRITGPKPEVDKIGEARVSINESSLSIGDQKLTRRPILYNKQDQPVHGFKINPPTVTVSVSVNPAKYEQLLSIVPDITGTVASGYRIDSITTVPQYVSVLSNAAGNAPLMTRPTINVSGLTGTVQRFVSLIVPAGIALKNPSQSQVNVTIDVVPIIGNAKASVPVTGTGQRQGTHVALNPSAVSVVYKGPLSALKQPISLHATIDLADRGPGTYHLVPKIDLSNSQLYVETVTPSSVRVTVTKK